MSTDTTTHDAGPDVSGRHPVNVAHLVMGIAFLGLVGVWATVQTVGVDGEDIRWLLPVPWVLAGLAGLMAIALGGRRRQARQAAQSPHDTDPFTHEQEQDR